MKPYGAFTSGLIVGTPCLLRRTRQKEGAYLVRKPVCFGNYLNASKIEEGKFAQRSQRKKSNQRLSKWGLTFLCDLGAIRFSTRT